MVLQFMCQILMAFFYVDKLILIPLIIEIYKHDIH